MPTTYRQAVDDIFTLFAAKWNAETTAIVGYIPVVQYQNIEAPGKIPTDKYWCRVSQKGIDEQQSSLSNSVIAPGNRNYSPIGLVFVQLFAPRSAHNAMLTLRALAEVARSAYRGKRSPNDVVFNRTRIVELDPDETFFSINVISEYEYDENG